MSLRGIAALMLAAALAACAGTGMGDAARLARPDADDPLGAAAALLVAAEETDAAHRAPLIARLDALAVAVLPDTGDDPLGQWRRENGAGSGAAGGPVYRGRTLGPGYRRARLAAGQRLVIDQIFNAGERAEMAAQTRAGQAVELAVANGQARKVCEARASPDARCRWVPIFTERFQITLINRGTGPASIYLVFD